MVLVHIHVIHIFIKLLKCIAIGHEEGGRPRENETWWWNNDVQVAIKEKTKVYKRIEGWLRKST